MTSMYAMSLFRWQVSILSWLHVGSGVAAYFLILLVIRTKILNGLKQIYFSYLLACILSFFGFVTLMLPKLLNIVDLPSQTVYLTANLLFSSWIYFNTQSSGKILLFKTVGSENSCFIDGVRSAFGAGMRILAYSTGYLFYANPVYFVLPIGMIHFVCICVLLWRHKVYLRRT